MQKQKFFVCIFSALAFLGLSSCTNPLSPGAFSQWGFLNTGAALSVAPSITIPMSSGYTYQFAPSGGLAPYSYAVSGSGQVTSTGVYTAGTAGPTDTLTVMDSAGNQVTSTIHLVTSLTNGYVATQALDSGGNLYVGGTFTSAYPYNAPYAAAIDPTSGAPVLSLDLQSGFNGTVNAIVVDPKTGSIYVGGAFTTYRGVTVNGIAKLNAYGVLDTQFSPPGSGGFTGTTYFGGPVNALALDPTGSLLYVGGSFTLYRGATANSLAKISTSNGALDPTLYQSGSVAFNSYLVSALALDSAGANLYVGGNFTSYQGIAGSANFIAKISTSNGALNTTFYPNGSGGFNSSVTSLVLSPTGNILYVGGGFATYQGAPASRIAKLSTSTGLLDTSLNLSGSGGFNSAVYALALDSTGSTLYVGGSFTAYQGVAGSANGIAKISTSNGALDTAFFPNGSGGFSIVRGTTVNALALNAAGTSLYVGGGFTTYQGVAGSANNIAKLSTSNGALDTTFHPSQSGGFSSGVLALVLSSSGNTLYAGGNFTNYGGTPVNNIVKFAPNLTLDRNFYPSGSGGFNGSVSAITLDSASNNLYVGGSFTSYRGVTGSANYIAKLSTSSGALDTIFQPNGSGGFNSTVFVLLLDPTNNYLYAGGSFTTYRTVSGSGSCIAKLSTSNGALDTTFFPNGSGGFGSATLSAFALDATNTYLYVGGSFTSYRRSSVATGIAKLSTSTGAIDSTFNSGAGSGFNGGSVETLVVDASGSNLYAGGSFFLYQGGTVNAIAKLSTTTATLDPTFYPAGSGGFTSTYVTTVNSIVFDPTGSYLYAAGGFANYRGTPVTNIAKLSTVGVLDTSFVAGTNGFLNTGGLYIYSLLLDPNNTLYAGGKFNTYQGSPCIQGCLFSASTGSQVQP